MGKHSKSDTCSKKGRCSVHLLELFPVSSSCYYKVKQGVRMCPKLNKFCLNHIRKTKNFENSVPYYNRDKKYYTPTFIIEDEQKYYAQNDQQMIRNHDERVANLGEGPTKTIVHILFISASRYYFNFVMLLQMVANHVRKRKYCSVCRKDYDDYLEHINNLSHKANITNNRFTRYINELQKSYRKHEQKNQGQETLDHINPKKESEIWTSQQEKQPTKANVPKQFVV